MVTLRWGTKLLSWALWGDDTGCCCCWSQKKKKIVCLIWQPHPLPFSATLCVSCGCKPLGCNVPLLVRQCVEPALVCSRCVLWLKKLALYLMQRVVTGLAFFPVFVPPFAPSEIFILLNFRDVLYYFHTCWIINWKLTVSGFKKCVLCICRAESMCFMFCINALWYNWYSFTLGT